MSFKPDHKGFPTCLDLRPDFHDETSVAGRCPPSWRAESPKRLCRGKPLAEKCRNQQQSLCSGIGNKASLVPRVEIATAIAYRRKSSAFGRLAASPWECSRIIRLRCGATLSKLLTTALPDALEVCASTSMICLRSARLRDGAKRIGAIAIGAQHRDDRQHLCPLVGPHPKSPR